MLPKADPALSNEFSARLAAERMLGPRGASMRSIPENEHGAGEHDGHNPGTLGGEIARTAGHLLEHGQVLLKELKLGSVLSTAEDVTDGPGPGHGEGHPHGKGVKTLSKLGVAGGIFQAGEGLFQVADGQTAEGAKNLVAGSMYGLAGVAELKLVEGVASKIAGPLAGGAAIYEGGYEIVEGVHEHNNEKITVGSVKAAGGALLGASPFVAGSVLGAPLGAVMATGGAVLIGGATIYEMFAH